MTTAKMVKMFILMSVYIIITYLDCVTSRSIKQKAIRRQQDTRPFTLQLRIRNGIQAPRWNPSAWFQSRDTIAGQRRSATTRHNWQTSIQMINRKRYSGKNIDYRTLDKSTHRNHKAVSSSEQSKKDTERSPNRMLKINFKLNHVNSQYNNRRVHNINILSANRRHRIQISHSLTPFKNASKGRIRSQAIQNKLHNRQKYSKKDGPFSTKTFDKYQSIIHNQTIKTHMQPQSRTLSVKNSAFKSASLSNAFITSTQSVIREYSRTTTEQTSVELNVKSQTHIQTTPETMLSQSQKNAPYSLSTTQSVKTKYIGEDTEIPESLSLVTTEEPDLADGTDAPEHESR